VPAQGSAPIAADNSYHFLLVKLHSLSGIIPIGVFVIFHLAVNASILAGPETFQRNVDLIHSIKPFLTTAEFAGIFIPIGFHAVLGVRIWWWSKSNTWHYPYADNIRYTLQRITALIALVFIVFHVLQMNWLGEPFKAIGGDAFNPEPPWAAYTAAKAIQASPWIALWYAIGIIAVCYHLANGLWTFLISWGITIGVNAQRKAGYVCAIIGIAVCGMGLAALRVFDRTPPDNLRLNPATERPFAKPQGGLRDEGAGWVVPPHQRRVRPPVAPLQAPRANSRWVNTPLGVRTTHPARIGATSVSTAAIHNPQSAIRNPKGAGRG
jgi:succinate dehydrogenase / fumarate reductase cytochrome b subunit